MASPSPSFPPPEAWRDVMPIRRICTYPGCNLLTENAKERRCKKHPAVQKERHREYDAKRESASKRGYDHKWAKWRRVVLFEEPFCRRCGDPSCIVDHIIPVRAGGEWKRENLQALCKKCDNIKKHEENKKYGPAVLKKNAN